jgi:fumarylpyruvate hydrolase
MAVVVPYPSLTKDMHHEIEMVVALKSGGIGIKPEKANDCIWGYGVGIDLTRRDLQIASRRRETSVGNRQGIRRLSAVRTARAGVEVGYLTKGRIALKVNGTVKQEGDLNQMIWNVAETIWKLSEMVELAAGDVIMTGTRPVSARVVPGDKIEGEIEGIGTLKVSIGQPKKS